jgi:hypothetical protein
MYRFLVFVFSLVVFTSAVSIGDRLIRTYTVYNSLPSTMSDALDQGWNSSYVCDSNLGLPFNYGGTSPSVDYPVTLYFTKGGQAAGVGVDVFGTLPAKLIEGGFWQQVENSQYRITVSFRSSSQMCSTSQSLLPLGDRLVINANSISYEIPTDASGLSNWHQGSCFAGMGHHWFYDLEKAPNMSWEADNLLPIVPMYFNGTVNAIFFASTSVQQGLLNSHWWEPIPLPNLLMCKNTCDSDCTFLGTSLWSTLHIYFNDYNEVTCNGGCTIGCCP